MNLNKVFILILVLTFTALAHVHQQTKIIQMAYQEQKRLAFLENLIDKNNNFRYNINRQTSLVAMADTWQSGDFEWPQQGQLVSLSTSHAIPGGSEQAPKFDNIFAGLFRLRSRAEATQIKPIR